VLLQSGENGFGSVHGSVDGSTMRVECDCVT